MKAFTLLTSTFIHANGVGRSTEQRIWEQGILTWKDFLELHERVRISESQRSILLNTISDSIEYLQQRDYTYFANVLPANEHWRAYDEFGSSVAFVDIETTGNTGEDLITVIGLYDGRDLKQFVRDINLEDFEFEAEKYAMLATFSGTSFDLPRLRCQFRGLALNQLHVDLCYSLRRLGLTGGLKRIEQKLGLRRSCVTQGLDGWDAVRLWQEHLRGSEDALELLLSYNAEDVVNLKTLLDYAYRELRKRCFSGLLI